jgi:hypothetical protein
MKCPLCGKQHAGTPLPSGARQTVCPKCTRDTAPGAAVTTAVAKRRSAKPTPPPATA